MHFCILNACEHKFLYIVGAGLCCLYATINSLFIHQITKFYVMPARKIFKCILITEFTNLVVYHVLFFQNFKFLRRRDRLYILRVWFSWSMCFYTLFPILLMHPLQKARCGRMRSRFFKSILCRREGFYATMKLFLFTKPLISMQRWSKKLFYAF